MGGDGAAGEVDLHGLKGLQLTCERRRLVDDLLRHAGMDDDEALAVDVASSSKAAGLKNAIGDTFEMGIAQFPRVNEDAMKGSTASGSCLVMFDKGDDAKKAAARLFVSYMTGAQAQARVAVATGYIPANAASAEDAAYQALLQEYPDYSVSLTQLTETPGSMRSVTVGPAKDFYYAIQNNVSDMLTYDLSPEETLSLMADELNGLLYQYNLANP